MHAEQLDGIHIKCAPPLLPLLQVWRVLTAYERLPDVVPNLESCVRLPSPKRGKVGPGGGGVAVMVMVVVAELC